MLKCLKILILEGLNMKTVASPLDSIIQIQIQIVYLTQTCIFLRHKKITLIIICLYMYMSWRSSKGYVAASARPPNLKYSFNN